MTPIELGIAIHQKITKQNNSPKCTVIFASCDDVTVTCNDKTDLSFLDESMVYSPESQTITCGSTSVKVQFD